MGRDISRATHTTSTATLVATTTRDERGLPVSTVDPRGTVAGATPAAYTTTYAYDALGQLTTITAPPVSTESGGQPATTVSPVSISGYNTYGDTVDTRDPRGAIIHATYDNAGRPTGTTLPAYTPPGATTPITASTTTAYDPAGRVTATTDRRGNPTTYGYDQLGNQRQKTDPPALFGQAGGTWLATHDPLGERLSTSDPTAARTYATYDQLGRQVTSTVAERVPAPTRNLTTSITYDPLGNPIKVTEPGGASTTATFDDLGNQLTSTNALGKTSSVSYDGAGRPTTATDPLGAKTTAGYDQAGQLTTQSDLDAGGAVLRTRGFGYDRAGNQTTATDPLGITTTQTFDAINQLTSTTRPTSATTSITSSYGYDKAGNITRATDGNNHATVFTVNPWNLPESTIEPATPQNPTAAARTYTVAYDRAGQVASLTKPGGVTIANTYDPQSNLTKQGGTGASVATPDRAFGYDAVGNLTSASAPGGSNTYSYDDRGNVVSATGPSGTSNFTVNDNNQQSSATTAAGAATYTYDPAGRLATAVDPLTGATASYGYDDADRLTSTGYGTGNATRSYSYHALGRPATDTVKNPAGTVTASTSYGFDTADHLTSKTTTGLAGAAANTYNYDQAGQLTSWNNGTATTDYGWDGAGNLTRDGPTTATYNERNQLTTKGTTSYTYTPRGTQASRTTGATTTNMASNAYDELITDGTTTNTYDGLDRLTTSGTATLTYAGTGRTITTDGTSTYSHTPGGTPLGVKQGATASMAVTDLHTDLTALLNPATGAVAGSRSYSPFGQVTATGGAQTALGYQGQYTDPGSGNVNMGARWYQPSTGGFASRDTAGLDPRDTATANRYGYTTGNPLTGIDPTGHNPICAIAGGVLGGFGGGFLGGIFGDFGGQIACPSGMGREWDIHDNPCHFNLCVVPDYDLERRQLQALVKRGGGVGPQQSGGCGKSCGNSGGRKPTGTAGKKHGTTGGKNSYSADDAAAARAAAERARAARVNNDALTPHARPQSDPTISPEIQALIDAANNQASIDLGTLGFRDASAQDKPYLPDADEQVAASPGSIVGLIAAGYLAYLASKTDAEDGDEGPPDGYEVFFGQKRADPNFSTKPGVPEYLKGRSLLDVAEDLRSGRIKVDQIRLEVFEYGGKLVSTNTRGLAALSPMPRSLS